MVDHVLDRKVDHACGRKKESQGNSGSPPVDDVDDHGESDHGRRGGDDSASDLENSMSRDEAEYRANLEVGSGASLEEIRVAYKRLMKAYHPDLHARDPAKREITAQIAQKLNEAMSYFEKKYKEI